MKLSVAAAAILTAASAFGAPPDRRGPELFSVSSTMFPDIGLSDPTPGSFEETVDIRPSMIEATAGFPWRYVSERSTLSVSLGYERLDFAVDGWTGPEPFPEGPYHSVKLPVMFTRDLIRGGWRLRAILTPAISSDFRGDEDRGFRLNGISMFEKETRRGLFSIGFVLTQQFGSPRLYPALAWSGRISERQTLVIRPPVQVSWSYQATTATSWGLAARMAGGNYEIGRPGPFQRRQLRYSTGTVGPFVRRSVGKWTLGMDVGYLFFHQLEVNDDRHQLRDYDLDRTGTVTLSVSRSL